MSNYEGVGAAGPPNVTGFQYASGQWIDPAYYGQVEEDLGATPMMRGSWNLPAFAPPVPPLAMSQTQNIFPTEYNFRTGYPIDPQQDLITKATSPKRGQIKLVNPPTITAGVTTIYDQHQSSTGNEIAGIGTVSEMPDYLSGMFDRRQTKYRDVAGANNVYFYRQFSDGRIEILPPSPKLVGMVLSPRDTGKKYQRWVSITRQIGTFAQADRQRRLDRRTSIATGITSVIDVLSQSQKPKAKKTKTT